MDRVVDLHSRHAVEIVGHAGLAAPPHAVDHPIFGVAVIVGTGKLQEQRAPLFGQGGAMLESGAVLSFHEDVESLLVDLHYQRAGRDAEHERQGRQRHGDIVSPHGFLPVVDDELTPLLEVSGIEVKQYIVVIVVIGSGNVDAEPFGIGRRMKFDGHGVVPPGGVRAGIEVGKLQLQTPVEEVGGLHGRFPGQVALGGKQDRSVEADFGHAELFGKVVDGGGIPAHVGDEAGFGFFVPRIVVVEAFLFDGRAGGGGIVVVLVLGIVVLVGVLVVLIVARTFLFGNGRTATPPFPEQGPAHRFLLLFGGLSLRLLLFLGVASGIDILAQFGNFRRAFLPSCDGFGVLLVVNVGVIVVVVVVVRVEGYA
mmetsp:Transcript_31050/g.53071  ORF Transcript_31050/g.53071 Transcript_31050/m.53071 type:complete len:367 (-) Transcript_31050:648-1748(-)